METTGHQIVSVSRVIIFFKNKTGRTVNACIRFYGARNTLETQTGHANHQRSNILVHIIVTFKQTNAKGLYPLVSPS